VSLATCRAHRCPTLFPYTTLFRSDNFPVISQENYESILTHESLMRWVEVLKKAPAFAFDTETDSLNNIDARLIGLSFAVEPGKRSEEHTSELQSRFALVCRLLLEK